MRLLLMMLLVSGCFVAGGAQTPGGESSSNPKDQENAPKQVQPDSQQVPHGKVLFSSRPEDPNGSNGSNGSNADTAKTLDDLQVSDSERDAVTFTSYRLDVHLVPERKEITVRVQMTVRNDGSVPLKRIALQVSSTLHWESLGQVAGGLPGGAVVQHRIDTDADHTGAATEALLSLKEPLKVGSSVELAGIYTGSIQPSAERLLRIGAPADAAAAADWDQASEQQVALRGYGNVLWYPVAGAPVFLGDGAKLFEAAGRTKLRQAAAKVLLRLEMEYVGEAPDAAYFCGRRQKFETIREDENVPVAESRGVATASWGKEDLGFRVPNLFVTDRATTEAGGGLVEAVSERDDAVAQYGQAAKLAAPLLRDWLGDMPFRPLTVIDHPGEAFEDKSLLLFRMRPEDALGLAPTLVHALSHSWFRSSHVWLDEGVAQMMSLLWVERTQGRDAAVAKLEEDATALALIEPAAGASGGESLVFATDEVYYRTKAAAVLWMLRAIAGDEAVKGALADYRKSADGERDFERLLEARSHQSLAWFFDDWVYKDKGLPDLSLVSVNPREMPAVGGKEAGWLVAVEVRNDGDAVADVPVTVRSGALHGELTKTERLRIPAKSTASTRIVFEGTPDEVVVNDGTVPEVGGGRHVREIVPAR